MEPQLARLRRRLEEDPGDEGACLEFARALARAGDPVAAYACLDAFLAAGEAPQVAALRAELLGAGRYREAPEPVPLESPDMGKPRTRHAVTALAFDPAEERLGVGKGSGDVWLLAPRGGAEPRYLGKAGKNKGIRSLAFDARGEALYSGGTDGFVRRWDPAEGGGTRVGKKLGIFVDSLAVYRGGVAAAGLGARVRVLPGGEVLEEATSIRQVCRRSAAHEGPGDPLEELAWQGYGADPAGFAAAVDEALPRTLLDHQESILFDLHGSAVAVLREGSLRLHRGEAWQELEDPRLVVRGPVVLAPRGRALAIGEVHLAIQHHPLDPSSRGLRLVFFEGGLRVVDLLDEDFVSAVAFSPSGGQLAVGTRTGQVYLLALVEEVRLAEPTPEAPVLPPSWETKGTRVLRPETTTRLARFEGPGLGDPAGRLLGVAGEVVMLGTPDADGLRVDPGPTCLSLKAGGFVPAGKLGGRRGFPARHPGSPGAPPAWAREAVEAPGAWAEGPEARRGAVVDGARPSEVLVLVPGGAGRPARLTCGGPVLQLAFSPRGTRLVALLEGGGVEVYGSA